MSRRLRELAYDPAAAQLIDDLAPGLHEAGNPYLDWLFGDPETALHAVCGWLRRDSSELSVRRVTVLERDERLAGAFVGVDGADMPACARADGVAALEAVGREGRAGFLRRARSAAGLRRPVEADQWLLSKLWVAPGERGAGLGRLLVREFVAAGERRGLPRCRVDARADDTPVLRLYESEGFEQRSVAHNPDGTIGVVEMVREP